MKTRHISSLESKQSPSGLRPFAAVCAMALAACVTIACSGRVAPRAPLPVSHAPAPAVTTPSIDGDPSVPAASQVLKGRVFDDGAEPASTF